MNVRSFFKAISILSVLFIMAGCEKDESPVEPEQKGPEVEKDGVVTLQIIEIINDSTLSFDKAHQVIDSLNISEIENRIDIHNAIPFHLDIINGASFGFIGDFHGVKDRVFVWTRYTDVVFGQAYKMFDLLLYMIME